MIAGRFTAALGLVAVLTACAPLPVTPTPDPAQMGIFRQGTLEEARRAVTVRVLTPTRIPPGFTPREVDYSPRAAEQWVVQRYASGDQVLFVSAEPIGAFKLSDLQGPRFTVQGLPAVAWTLPRQDGGVSEYRLFWPRGDTLYVVGGSLPAEELVAIAESLR